MYHSLFEAAKLELFCNLYIKCMQKAVIFIIIIINFF